MVQVVDDSFDMTTNLGALEPFESIGLIALDARNVRNSYDVSTLDEERIDIKSISLRRVQGSDNDCRIGVARWHMLAFAAALDQSAPSGRFVETATAHKRLVLHPANSGAAWSRFHDATTSFRAILIF